ncbi:bifunctional Nop domain/Nop [Babesia duncani]|uniref:Bifunctional Nop domain/Nop n=1 Tax=Babesia duncani TaxID=323732 RepID=A0AAD9UN89_9APIC|nr:bifunctional Nop domain/Nop [Babesia duncani]
MLVLLETPAGYGLFRITDSRLLECSVDDIPSFFENADVARSSVTLEAFSKFKKTEDALREAFALSESRMGKGLKKFLTKNVVEAENKCQIGVCDRLLGVNVQQALNIDVVYNPSTVEIIRGLKTQFFELISGLTEEDVKTMSLSLSHSLTRFRLKFSPDKVDVMIVQAIGLLDDLDRDANNFAMRLKEWFGWHFPELSRIITDNLTYAKVVFAIERRENVNTENGRRILNEMLEAHVVEEICRASEISMGSDLMEEDLIVLKELSERLQEMLTYRNKLEEYLRFRMRALAPNLTYMVGEIIGARLLSHSGSLISLAKHPASTVQILGAEKALFRALKTHTKTPKYGIIYHAAFVGQAAPKSKGKISRILAAKLALCIRVDALLQSDEVTVAIENRKYIERKLEQLSAEVATGSGPAKRPGSLYKPKWPEKKQKH